MINIYQLELTSLQRKILELLFIKTGTTLNQRQIAKSLEVSQPAVMKALPALKNSNLIKIQQDKESRRWSIELNRDDHKAMQLKRIDNLRLIYHSGLADFLEREFAGGTIILFGSYSRGEDTINSDIDLAIIGRKEKPVNLLGFESILKRKININFYDSFKNIHKHLRENILNGFIITGGIEL